ncbi:hypothetical protein [Nocardioides massiliensis]|uniref:Integral membrane protein n=1 Tax=Nocardioides massiliensis TaxID=1325935 RepID=A0ABT9NQB6_9ACTN|nr:hypothetical protein [Nocardioides massiliensis]MDP9822374.1 hypothetical protein [Nocardioides massiliensis]
MTEYQPYPSEGPEPVYQPGSNRGPRPSAVDTALKLIWAGIALGVISALLTFVYLDDLVDAALENADATMELSESAARGGAIASVIFGLVVGVGLMVLVAVFIGKGANWARIVFTVLGVLSVLGVLLTLTNPSGPVILLILSLVQVILTIAAIVLLFKSESSAWFKSA